ncbi:MAG: primosomal protein N' [Bacilli bacterium]
MVANVLVQTRKIDKTFTYLVPKQLEDKVKVGSRCLVSFSTQKLEGFIVELKDNFVTDYDLKELIDVIDINPVLNKELLDLGVYLSKKTLCTLTQAYQTMLPSALKAKQGFIVNKKMLIFLIVNKEYEPMTTNEKRIFALLKNNKILLSEANKISAYSVKKLIEQGVFIKKSEESYRLKDDVVDEEKKIILTEEQKEVIKKITFDIFKPYLLHGVTGSGKTEVYMQLINEVLQLNKEALVLVPEISLTPQLVETFKKRFGYKIAILHSHLSNGEKYDEWRRIEKKEVSIVIGARSAIFAPLTNLGIIIIDEEHSSTYKQENIPQYNAIDMALYRCKKNKCPLILGSATPSIESYTRASNGIYTLLKMTKRVNNNMPKVYLVDMKEEMKKRNNIFSSLLKQKIKETLDKKEQIILLLNRRGYSTIVTCKNCGYTMKCQACDIPLTYHLNKGKMICHYCNHEENKLTVCPICQSRDINERGMGTEKLEQEVNKLFPYAKTLRMDVDTTRTKKAHQNIIKAFEKEEYNILIGTQMIAKGLDFPKVTLVGVINADASLAIPDFRSGERTFQLLSQVSGRSGRSALTGEVVIQGFNIDHYSLIKAATNDYIGFYKEEMKIRSILKYPPFYNLSLIKIQGIDSLKCSEEANKIAKYLEDNLKEAIILGPSTGAIPKINNVYFYQIIIKYKDTSKVLESFKFINNKYRNNLISVTIDFNPNRI